MITTERLFGKVDAVVAKIKEAIAGYVSEEAHAHIVERYLLNEVLKLGRELMIAYFEGAGDGDVGETCDRKGQVLKRLSEARERTYASIFGRVIVERAVYAKRARKKLYAPLDEKLGFPAGEHSYVVRDFLEHLSVQISFQRAVAVLDKFFDLGVGQLAAEKANQSFGADIGEIRKQEIDDELPEKDDEFLVASIDGKGVPMKTHTREHREMPETPNEKHARKKREAKEGEQSDYRRPPGNGAKRKQMAWLGVVYSTAPYVRTPADVLAELCKKKDPDREPKKSHPDRPKPKNKRLRAMMTDYIEGEEMNGQDEVFDEVAKQIQTRTKGNDKTVICLMDGQTSLWRRQAAKLPNAIPILDIFHASEYVWKAAYYFNTKGSKDADKYFERNFEHLITGNVDSFIRSLRAQMSSLKSDKKKKAIKSIITFCLNHKDMMKYDEYLAAGYPIGSGVIEGGCRHLVGDRMNLTGMKWKIDGAQAMLNTRSTFINGDWESKFKMHIQKEQTELYGQPA